MSELRDATCLHCHQTIRVKIDDDGNEGRWFHLRGFRRGCRSASSCNAEGRPDESLKGTWRANPEPGTERPFAPPQIHEHLARRREASELSVTVSLTNDHRNGYDWFTRHYRTVADRDFFYDTLTIDSKPVGGDIEIMKIPEGGTEDDAVAFGVKLRPGSFNTFFDAMSGFRSFVLELQPLAWEFWSEIVSADRAEEIMAACLAGASEDERVRAEVSPDRYAVGVKRSGKPPGGVLFPCESREAAEQLAREKGGEIHHLRGTDEPTAREWVRRRVEREAAET
jgi:hypothetical protein